MLITEGPEQATFHYRTSHISLQGQTTYLLRGKERFVRGQPRFR